MSRDTEERILDEAKAQVRKNLAKWEAEFLALRWGLACAEFPQIMRAAGRQLYGDVLGAVAGFDERLAKLESLVGRIEALEARMDKAAKLVGEIDRHLRGQNGKPAQPTRR